jgi:replicative DNA helicase
MAVLGSLLIDGDSIHAIRTWLKTEDFFSPENQHIFEACLNICNRGEEIDQITVAHELNSQKRLEGIGGASYLSKLIIGTPTSLHVEHFGRIVKNTAIQRRVISFGSQIMELGYAETDNVKLLGEIGQRYLDIQKQVNVSHLITPMDSAKLALERYSRLEKGQEEFVTFGIPALDYETGGAFPGEYWIFGARPGVGKSSLLLDFAKHMGITHGATLLVSLEMTHGAIKDRQVSSELDLPIKVIRRGGYDEDLMGRITYSLGAISEYNVYFYGIGGAGEEMGVTTTDLYSIANYMKMSYGLKAIIIDYLGMFADRFGQSSYERMSHISRRVKSMASALDVPIICAAQLSRALEHMSEKRPQLADIRECLAGDTEVLTRYGKPTKIKDLQCGVLSLDLGNGGKYYKEGGKYLGGMSGIKEVYKVKAQLGLEIKATLNHKFLTPFGFFTLGELKVGDYIGTVGNIAHRHNWHSIDGKLALLLGYLLGDGGLTRGRCATFSETDNIVIDDMVSIVKQFFPSIEPKFDIYNGATEVTLSQKHKGFKKNELINWLRKIGVWGQYSHEREIPDFIFSAHKKEIAELLKGLFTADGCVKHGKKKGSQIVLDTNSKKLANQVRALLWKFGITATLGQDNGYYRKEGQAKQRHIMYRVGIRSRHDLDVFIQSVGFIGKKVELCKTLIQKHSRGKSDMLPPEVSKYIYDESRKKGISWSKLQYEVQRKTTPKFKDATVYKGIEKQRAIKVAEILGDERLANLARINTVWISIENIEYVGQEMTYDIEVPKYHNFIANGFVVHNSGRIEEDADSVVFLYRDDYYPDKRKEDPNDPEYNLGKAELLIAKQRQGEANKRVDLVWDNSRRCYRGTE